MSDGLDTAFLGSQDGKETREKKLDTQIARLAALITALQTALAALDLRVTAIENE